MLCFSKPTCSGPCCQSVDCLSDVSMQLWFLNLYLDLSEAKKERRLSQAQLHVSKLQFPFMALSRDLQESSIQDVTAVSGVLSALFLRSWLCFVATT